MTVKFTNNASTTVGTGINTSATSLTVASASSFPSLSGADDYCYLTIQQGTGTVREVVKATALSGNTFTIVRAQDNTSAGTWSAEDIVELRMTAALLTDVIDAATVEGVKTNFQYTPTSGQTVFSGADDDSNTLIINQAALVSVYMNGVRLVQGTDYSVSSANNTVTLTAGATTADIIDIEVFGNFTGQSGAAVAITGGAISGTSVAATTLSASGTATLNTFVSNNITVSGGSLDGVTIGGTTRGAISGNAISGTSFASTGNMTFGDNDKAIFGAGSDLQIYHDGSNSYISDQGTGSLVLQGSNLTIEATDGTNYIAADDGVSVYIYHPDATNQVKLSTTSTGIAITGTATGATSFSTAAGGTFTTAAGNDLNIVYPDSRSLFIKEGSTTHVTVNNVGSVGIGETSPLGKLHIKGSDTGATASAQGNSLVLEDTENGLSILSSTAGAGYINFGDSDDNDVGMIIYGHSSNSMNFWTNAAERMRIDNGGNVGIGVTNMGSAGLSILNSMNFNVSEGANSSFVNIFRQASSAATVVANGYRYTDTANKMESSYASSWAKSAMALNYGKVIFYTDSATTTAVGTDVTPTERMRLDASGTLLVGKTSTTLSVAGTYISASGSVGVTRASDDCLTLNRTGNDGAIATFYKAGTSVGSIGTANGDSITIGGSTGNLILYAGTVAPSANSSGGASDGVVDLGTSARRFKDLYLSGNISTGTGGVNANNYQIKVSAGTTGLSRFIAADTSDAGYIDYEHSSDSWIHRTAGAERMRISGGNVLIGTNTVAYAGTQLNIGDTSDAESGVQIQSAVGGVGYVLFGDGASAAAYRGQINYNHASDVMGFNVAGAEAMRLSGGNLQLRATGNIEVGGYNSGTDYGIVFTPANDSTHWHIYNDAGGHLAFGSSGTVGSSEKARLDSSGNFLLGTTSTGSVEGLYVAKSPSNVNAGVARFDSTRANDESYTVASFVKASATTDTSQIFITFGISGYSSACGRINANGSGQAAFGTNSDRRLKENITDLPNQLASITALRPVEYDYIESEGGGHQTGFIAQEVEEIYPDLVGERDDGMKTLTGISKMEARLIKAIQEQNELINELRARVAQLES